jgi:hypothetical protein
VLLLGVFYSWLGHVIWTPGKWPRPHTGINPPVYIGCIQLCIFVHVVAHHTARRPSIHSTAISSVIYHCMWSKTCTLNVCLCDAAPKANTPIGAIVGGVAGATVIVLGIGAAIGYFCFGRKGKNNGANNDFGKDGQLGSSGNTSSLPPNSGTPSGTPSGPPGVSEGGLLPSPRPSNTPRPSGEGQQPSSCS